MMRKAAFLVPTLAVALAAGALSGCKVQVQAKAGDEQAKKPPPPPPPPPPKKEEPKPAPAPAPAPEPQKPPEAKATGKIETKGDALHIPGNIVFDVDKATLKAGAGSEVVLEQLKQYLVENDKKLAKLRIEGHTDNQGTADHNLELSGQRALTIKKWLVEHGIDEKRLVAVGFGQTKPIAPNDKEEGRAQNRRTEFHIAETYDKAGKARPYLGMNPLGGGKEFK